MTDQSKTKAQLISELAQLRQKITELESTKDNYQTLFENLPVGIFQSTPSGQYRLANPTFAKIVGYTSPEEMVNSIEDISPLYADPDERENVKRIFAETGQLNGHIIRHLRADGQTRWMSIYGKAVYNDAGEIDYYDGFSMDITERKLAETALKEREELLGAIFENSLNAIMVADDLGNYILVNQATTTMFGYSMETLLTMNVGDLRTKSMPDAAKRYEEYLQKGQEIGEFDFIRADNQPRIAQYHAVRVRENFNLSVLSDITEQMLVEQELKETNRFNKHITNTVPNLVYVFDLIKGHNIYINHETEKILGVLLSDLQTKRQSYFLEQIHPDDVDKLDEFNMQWQEAGDKQVFQKEYRLKDATGAYRWIHSYERVFQRDYVGNPTQILGTAVDITERKQVEERLKRSAAALEKAQQVAHLGSWSWHIKTNKLEWSDEMYRVFGIDKETFSGDLSEVTNHAIHPDDRAKVEESNLAVINDNRPSPLEYRVVWPDSTVHVVWAEAGELILDEDGNAAILTGIAQDITERKQVEEALFENQKRYEKAQAMGHVGNWEYDPITTKFWGSDEAKRIFGFDLDSEDFTTDTVESCIPERERVHQVLIDLIEHDKKYDIEFDIITNDKGLRKTIHSIAEIERDAEGNPVKITGVISDITQRKQVEKSLRASENQFRRAVTDSPVPIMIHDDEDNILQLSKGWTHYSGYTIEDIPTLADWTKKAYGSASGIEKKYIDELFKINKTVYNGEWTVTAKDGSKRIWEFKTTPLGKTTNGKRLLHSLAVDITERTQVEKLQKELSERIEAGLRAGNVAWWEMELPSGRTIFDDRKAEMLGYASELFKTYEDFTNLLHPDDYERAMQAMRDHLEGTADTYEVEYRLKMASGDYKWFRDVGCITEIDEKSGITRIVGIVEDIHTRKQSQKTVEESEALYKSVVSALNEGLVVQNTAGQIIMSNDSAARILRLTTRQLMGKDSYDPRWKALHEDGSTLNPEDHPSMITMRTGKPIHNFIMNVYTGDKNRALISINSQPVFNAKKEVAGSVVTFTDITRQKQAERAQKQLTLRLEQQAHQLQMVMDSVPEGVFVIDSNGIILLTNPTAGKDLIVLAGGIGVGDRLEQLGGNSLDTLLAPPPVGFWHQIAWQNRNFELIAKPLKGSEAETGWVVVIRDVTTEKEVEKRIQQQDRLASVGQLAAGIAHDFNNIMSVISLYAELTLEDPRLPSDLHRRFETISKQSEFAVALIRQILDFSRRSTMERLPMNLIPFFSELVKLFERTLPEDIDIRLHFSNYDLMINGDPTRLQQAIMNLIVNARDAMPEGGILKIDLERLPIDKISTGVLPELAHRLKHEKTPENWVRLTVQDTGIGIPADILPHIFEPFYTTKEHGKGTGLGLAQVFGIIKQHEGELDVISKEGEGSTFIVYLPLLENENSRDTMLEPEPFLRGQGEIILVVEDNISMQQVLIDALEKLNYRTQIAKNGREALHFLKEHDDEIALVLTDLVMPEMGGKALVQEMKQAGIPTKIIIMTGHPLTDEKETIMALGVEDWLDKPLSLEKLGQAIWYALLK